MTSYYGAWDGDTYPSFLEQVDQVFTNYSFMQVITDWKAYEQAVSEGKQVVAPVSPRPATLDSRRMHSIAITTVITGQHCLNSVPVRRV